MNGQLLLQGFELLLLGMGIVFGFLILLVFMLRGMSGLAARLEPAASPQETAPTPATAGEQGQIIAAISIAIAKYRASHKS